MFEVKYQSFMLAILSINELKKKKNSVMTALPCFYVISVKKSVSLEITKLINPNSINSSFRTKSLIKHIAKVWPAMDL